jgi:hypothetical protein
MHPRADITADSELQQLWTAPVIASQAVVMSLCEVYFEIVYPIFPLFHRPTYIRKVSAANTTVFHICTKASLSFTVDEARPGADSLCHSNMSLGTPLA